MALMNRFSDKFYSYFCCLIILCYICLCHEFCDCEYSEADTPCPLFTADLECHEYTCSDFRLLDESDTYCDDHHMIFQDMRPYENNECIIPSVCEEFKKCVRYCEPEFRKCVRYCEPEVQKCVHYCDPEVKKCIRYCEPEVKKCIQYLELEVRKCILYVEPEVKKCIYYCEPEVRKCIHYCEPEFKKCTPCCHKCSCESKPKLEKVIHVFIQRKCGSEEDFDCIKKSYWEKERSVCYAHRQKECSCANCQRCRPISCIRNIPCRRKCSFL